MKRILSILSMAALLAVAMPSCKKDPCGDVVCENGNCNDGTCECDSGYEGSGCDTAMRTKFLGTFTGTETCTSGNYSITWSVTTSSTGIANVIINDIYLDGVTVSATVSGTSITIPSQNVTVNGNSVSFDGTGQINGTVLTLTYTAAILGQSDTCTATMTKQ